MGKDMPRNGEFLIVRNLITDELFVTGFDVNLQGLVNHVEEHHPEVMTKAIIEGIPARAERARQQLADMINEAKATPGLSETCVERIKSAESLLARDDLKQDEVDLLIEVIQTYDLDGTHILSQEEKIDDRE